MYTDWSEIASKRKWNAAKYWEETMNKLETLPVGPEITPEVESEPAPQPEMAIETLSEEQKKLRRIELSKKATGALLVKNPNYFKEIAKKSATTLLARNPNHFKELAAKAHQKRKIITGI